VIVEEEVEVNNDRCRMKTADEYKERCMQCQCDAILSSKLLDYLLSHVGLHAINADGLLARPL
jgi:hypothetical protein